MAEITKDITIGEALDIRGKAGDKMRGFIEAAGRSMDDKWSSLADRDFLIKLNEVGTESTFVELLSTQNTLARSFAERGEPSPFTNVFGAGGQARTIKVDKQPLSAADQARRKKKPIAVPAASEAIPAFMRGINAIPDEQTRTAVAFNMLVPLRPGEVAKIGIDDIDFETGKFKEAWIRGNKIRNAIELPEVALELLRDARDKAIANGQSNIFDTSTPKMTKATKVKGGIRDQFKIYESILGRPFVGASDIRKIIPSLMVGELKLGIEVSTIMGHASTDEMFSSLSKMTANSYISPIMTSEGSSAKLALRGYHNLLADVLGLSSLNEIPDTFGFSASRLTAEGSPKIAVIPKGSDVVLSSENTNIGTINKDDVELFEAKRDRILEETKLGTVEAKTKRLTLEGQLGELDEAAIRAKTRRKLETEKIQADETAKFKGEIDPNSDVPESNPEAEEKLKRKGVDFDAMSDLFKKFKSTGKIIGKGILGAFGIETARMIVQEPATFAGEVATGLTGKVIAGGVGTVAAPLIFMGSKEMGESELQPDDDRPATQEELIQEAVDRGSMTREEAMQFRADNDPQVQLEIMEQEAMRDAGFINIDRKPEADSVNRNQGFLSN